MKRCAKCKKNKSIDEFYKRGNSYCIECTHLMNRKSYQKNKKWHRNYYKKNKDHIDEVSREYATKTKSAWYEWLREEYGYPVKCSLCEKNLYFDHKDKQLAPHFDHRNGEIELLKLKSPSGLFRWKINEEKKKLFKSCNFGILCDNCNKLLPSDVNKRKVIAKNLINYVEGYK